MVCQHSLILTPLGCFTHVCATQIPPKFQDFLCIFLACHIVHWSPGPGDKIYWKEWRQGTVLAPERHVERHVGRHVERVGGKAEVHFYLWYMSVHLHHNSGYYWYILEQKGGKEGISVDAPAGEFPRKQVNVASSASPGRRITCPLLCFGQLHYGVGARTALHESQFQSFGSQTVP